MITEDWHTTIKQMLIHDEGFKTFPYEDLTGAPARARNGAGFITIGVGRNLEAVGLSEETILMMLQEDIDKALSFARLVFGEDFECWDAPKQHAIVSMIFNLGPNGFLKFKKFIQAAKEEDWNRAGDEAESSRWYTQNKARAKRLIKLIKEGIYDYPTIGTMPVRSC